MTDNNNASTSATFECAHCGEEKPIAERELVAFEYWCRDCVDHFDLPNDLD